MSNPIFNAFFNKLVQQSIELGNNYMRPIFSVSNKDRLGGEYLSPRKTFKKEDGSIEETAVDATVKRITKPILDNPIYWDACINNPERRLDSKLQDVVLRPYEIYKGEKSLGFYPMAHATPIHTINTTLLPFIQPKYTIDENGTSLQSVPIFFIVKKPVKKTWNPIKYATETSHLSVIVACNGLMYSFGFGTTPETLRISPPKTQTFINAHLISRFVKEPFQVNKGVFLTPDANPFLHTPAGENYTFDIVDIGLFTKKHADALLDITQYRPKTKTMNWYFEVEFKKDKSDTDYVYPQMSFQVPNIEYKLCSTLKNTTYNCTTYIEKIFENRIQCIGISTNYSKPTRCTRISDSLTKEDLDYLLHHLVISASPTATGKKCCGRSDPKGHLLSLLALDIKAGVATIVKQRASVLTSVPAPYTESLVTTRRESPKSGKRASKRNHSVSRPTGVAQTARTSSITRRQSVRKSGKSTRRSRA